MSEIDGIEAPRPLQQSTGAAALNGANRARSLVDVQAEVAQQVERRAEAAGAGRSNRSLGITPP